MEEKQYLLDLRRKENITTQQLCEHSQLPLNVVYTVEIGGFIDRDLAKKSSRRI